MMEIAHLHLTESRVHEPTSVDTRMLADLNIESNQLQSTTSATQCWQQRQTCSISVMCGGVAHVIPEQRYDMMWCDVTWRDVSCHAISCHVMSCWTSSFTLLDRPAYWLSGDQYHRGQSDTVRTNKNVTPNNVFISLHQSTSCDASQRSLYGHRYSDCMLLRDRTDHWQGPWTLHPVSVPWVCIPSLLSTGLDWLAQSRQHNIMEKWCW